MSYRLVLTGIFLLLPLLYSASLHAQSRGGERYSFEFRGATLTEALEEVANEAGINMVYDPALADGISVYKRVQRQSVSEVLKSILEGTSLDFVTLSTGTIVIVRTVQDRPSYGSYYGRVADRQTGRPLPGATVMLADASGGTSAGPNGTFALNRLMSGSYTIIFSYVGYEPVYKTIHIGPGQDLREEVSLQPGPVDVAPVIVTGHTPQLPVHGSNGQSVHPFSEWEITGAMQDAIRSLSLFSGVQYGLPVADLHLQGGQRGDHRILLDGVPVYNPQSFGRMFSAFSPYAIHKVQLHKAGYGVPEGSQIAGLINLSHDVNGFDRSRALFQADPLSVNLRGDLVFPDSGESSLKIMTAARSNYWNIYKEPRLDQTLREWNNLDPLITNLLIDSDNDASLYEPREHHSEVRFYDLHMAAHYEINPYSTLSSSLYTGKNFVGTDLLRQAPPGGDLPEYLYARDEYDWNNIMGQITYNQLVSPRLDLSTQVSLSSNRFRHYYKIGTNHNPHIGNLSADASIVYSRFQESSIQRRVPTQRNTNRIRHVILRSDGTYSFNPRMTLDAGLRMDYLTTHIDLTDLFYLPTLSDQRSALFSGYLNGNWVMGEYWKLILGSRATLANSAGRLYTEPRASIQYDRPDARIGYWSALLSGGLYRQFINQFEITNPGPTSLVPSFTVWSHAGTSEAPKAWHVSGSFYLEPAENTSVHLEWFYKWQPTAYIISYHNLLEGTAVNRSGFDAFAEAAEMNALGGGIRLNRSFMDSRLKLMLGYDYSNTRIDMETQFGRKLPAPWGEPHRFQFRSLWRMASGFTAVARWQSVFGRSWGFRQAYYNYLFYESGAQFDGFSFANPEDDRLSPFHQLDLSLVYKPRLEFMNAELRLDLINLLNRHNTIDWSLRPRFPEESGPGKQYKISERTMPGFSPSFSVQVRF